MKASRIYVVGVCVVLMSLATGFLMGWFLSREMKKDKVVTSNGYKMAESFSVPVEDWARDIDPEITKKLMEKISAEKIEQNLR